MQPGDVPITFADITKARAKLGYHPQVKIEQGIKKFAEWLKRARMIFNGIISILQNARP